MYSTGCPCSQQVRSHYWSKEHPIKSYRELVRNRVIVYILPTCTNTWYCCLWFDEHDLQCRVTIKSPSPPDLYRYLIKTVTSRVASYGPWRITFSELGSLLIISVYAKPSSFFLQKLLFYSFKMNIEYGYSINISRS